MPVFILIIYIIHCRPIVKIVFIVYNIIFFLIEMATFYNTTIFTQISREIFLLNYLQYIILFNRPLLFMNDFLFSVF